MHSLTEQLDLLQVFKSGIFGAVKISLIVFVMMIIVDFINVKVKGKMTSYFSRKKWQQYIMAGLIGIIPGCGGTFAIISLYIHGTITMGALTATMIATSGDEAFIMLSMFPKTAFILFGVLFVLGVLGGFIADFVLRKTKFKYHVDCKMQQFHPEKEGWNHYFKEHIYEHIFKNHVIKIFLWTMAAIWVIHILNHYIDLERFAHSYPLVLIMIAALVGLIPESGPHIFFLNLFAAGTIPFSVLLTNSISQDGHGVLPLISVCIKDTVIVKAFNLIYAIVIGMIVYWIGF